MTEDRAAAFLEDILDQPAMLAGLLDTYGEPGGPLAALPDWTGARGLRIAFVGLGSSRYAALDAAPALRARGIAAWAEVAARGADTSPSPDTVLVAISASGGTPEVVETVERHRGRGRGLVIGVTNRPDSPLGRGADIVLPLLAGRERAGISSLTYPATRAVLALLADRLAGDAPDTDALRPAVDELERLAAGRATWLDRAANILDRASAVGVLAPPDRLGLAEQGALMLREAPRLPGAAHETGEWSHTAIYTALPGYRAVVVAGSTADEEVVRTIHDRGGEVLAIGAVPGADLVIQNGADGASKASQGYITAMTIDLLAATLWARATADDKGA